MREYEVALVIHPDLDETAFNEVIEKVQDWITGSGGNVSKVDVWGKRTLAYPILKQREGQYVIMQTTLAPSFCIELERNLRFLEPLMRFLLTSA